MTQESIVPPSLSTHQDDSVFEFDRAQTKNSSRKHLHGIHKSGQDLTEAIYQYYSIDNIANFINQKEANADGKETFKYKAITLQFPDDLICDSATIVQALQDRNQTSEKASEKREPVQSEATIEPNTCGKCQNVILNDEQQVWILADTSYSPCCVDEVAAEHVKSDLVVHFGDACLNPVRSIPTLYVFGKPYVDEKKVVQDFLLKYDNDREKKIVLMADAPHSHCLKGIYDELIGSFPNLVYADLSIDAGSRYFVAGRELTGAGKVFKELNRVVLGLNDFEKLKDITPDEEVEFLQNYDLFHLGVPTAPKLLQLTTYFQDCVLYDTSDYKLVTGPFPNLLRRYKFMNVARTAGTIGLLVNTLSLSDTKDVINKLSHKIKSAGKKYYLFVVGKPNVAKLANFESVDIWCIIGCNQNGIIIDETNEYFKPIVTPYELLLALKDEVTWTGKWFTSFNLLLDEMQKEANDDNASEDEGKDSDEDEAPDFDLVTGTFSSKSRPLRRLKHLQISQESTNSNDDEGKLVKKLSGAVVLNGTVSTSAEHLQQRAWSGLGSDYDASGLDSSVGALVEEGRDGIARGYNYDQESTN